MAAHFHDIINYTMKDYSQMKNKHESRHLKLDSIKIFLLFGVDIFFLPDPNTHNAFGINHFAANRRRLR